MPELTRKDLEIVLDISLQAQACPQLESFCHEVMPQLRRLVPCDSVGYNEVDLQNGTAFGDTDPPGRLFEGVEDHFVRVMHEHPLVARQARGDLRPALLSDFVSERRFHSMALYQDLYKLLDTEDQIAFGLPGEVMVAIAINRSQRTFTRRDLDVLEILRPHLSRAYAQLIDRQRTAALLQALEDGLEHRDAALIQVDRLGRIMHASAAAVELLAAYCGPATLARVPEPITDWRQADGSPLIIEGPRGRLRVRVLDGPGTDWDSLLLEERRVTPPTVESLQELGVTRRQAQVLRLLVCGKRNHEIAQELLISRETVRKHLEHIYHHLGVSSRGEAIARVLR